MMSESNSYLSELCADNYKVKIKSESKKNNRTTGQKAFGKK